MAVIAPFREANELGVLADCVPFPRLHQADRERVRL